MKRFVTIAVVVLLAFALVAGTVYVMAQPGSEECESEWHAGVTEACDGERAQGTGQGLQLGRGAGQVTGLRLGQVGGQGR